MSTFLSSPCNKGHNSSRRKNGNCIQCEKERYKSDPKYKEKVKARQAARRAAIKADPEKLQQQREYMKEYSRKNRKRLNEQNAELYQKNNARIRLQRKGIDPTPELIAHVEKHCGLCDICESPGDDRWKQLAVDHCHDSNKFRGMLCGKCNKAIGLFQDNPDLLRRAIDYLSR